GGSQVPLNPSNASHASNPCNADNSHSNESTNVSSVLAVNKKKFGKFRILNDNSDNTCEDNNTPVLNGEDICLDIGFDRALGASIETMSTQSESSAHDMSEPSSAAASPNTTPNRSTKRRGRPAGSTNKDKLVIQMATQLLEDDDDLSRRRSSRLKTLEARKEQEKGYYGNRQTDIDDTSRDSSIVNTSDANESQHSVVESSVSTKQKKKKSKKDKNKSKEKSSDSKKSTKRKKKCLVDDKYHSYDENNENSHHSEFFTPPLPPSHYQNIRHNKSCVQSSNKCTTDSDDSCPLPQKLKSRWRRNSELESGHQPGFAADHHQKQGAQTVPIIIPKETEPHPTFEMITENNYLFERGADEGFGWLRRRLYFAADHHQKQGAQTVPIIIPKETEPHPTFEMITENNYLFERRKSKSKKETRRMVCDCILTKEERTRGLVGCGEDCLNRMLMIECGSRCALGDHCANKRFQKRQYAKIEPFRTAKKGWGLRTLEPLQPNTFIMEYIGEVIDPLDFHNRTQKYSKEKIEHHYFMALKSDEI
ncbi:unnamed protein product, partial [Medioppia subpectinata]